MPRVATLFYPHLDLVRHFLACMDSSESDSGLGESEFEELNGSSTDGERVTKEVWPNRYHL